MKKVVFLILLISCVKPSLNIPKIQSDIHDILFKQKTFWNNGDLQGFMSYYWNSDSLTFQSGNQRILGWGALFSKYETGYPREKMGTLDFTDIQVRVISKDFVYVLGRWKVVQNETASEGLFTLLFRKTKEGWRIVHDHTS